MVHLSSVSNKDDVQSVVKGLDRANFFPSDEEDSVHASVYGSSFAARDLPKTEMPDTEMPKDVAYRLIKDDLTLDGTPTLNLASFVTTYMEDEAEKLMQDAFPKNFIDYEEYPVSADIQNRCVNMIARLYNAPCDDESAVMGTSTIGSSEAIMLATLAMKKRWANKRKAQGLPYDKPNIIMNSAVQVCWEKAARYFDVEEKYVYCTQDRYVIDPAECVDLVDENTIGICAIIGTTYTGEYEDVKAINDLLVKKGLDVYIHVDAASGGFVAPFVNPSLEWDFRLPRVCSINVSGHKYGLVYPGVGWVVWRDPEFLPKELIFNINYLGADQASFTLNFSKGASQVIGQYYQMIRLGKRGYRSIMTNLTRTADYLSSALQSLGFIIMSQGGGAGLPLVAFRLDPSKTYHHDEFAIAHALRERGWVVPAYTMAPHSDKLKMMRVVVREDFSRSRCDALITDMKLVLDTLKETDAQWMKDHMQQMQEAKRSHVPKQHPKLKKHYGKGHKNLQSEHDKSHPARTGLILVFILLSFLFLFKPYAAAPATKGGRNFWGDLSRPIHDYAGTPRIAKISMLYGDNVNPYYVRALRSHRTHNERWNYGMHVLDQNLVGGYWNKPSYLMSLLVQELAKRPDERVEWFMWVDADLILVNPAIPLEIFLPPPEYNHINFLGTRDQKGLNSGTFFIRVCPWSVQMLAKSIALPMFQPDLDLDVQVDQTSMAVILNETAFNSKNEVAFHPRVWYNAFQFHGHSEWQKGDLLIHFPGLEEDRWHLMEEWLGKIEHSPEAMATPLPDTRYPKAIAEYWKTLKRANKALASSQDYLNESSEQPAAQGVMDAAQAVRHLISGTELSTAPGTDLMQMYEEKIQQLEELVTSKG